MAAVYDATLDQIDVTFNFPTPPTPCGPASPNSADVEYGPSGFTPGTGTVLANQTSPVVISGPFPGPMDVYVTGNCGADQSSTIFLSVVLCGATPTLSCSNPSNMSSNVLYEDWENGNAAGWTGDIGTGATTGDWNIRNTPPTSGNGPLSATCGNFFVYYETTGTNPTPAALNFPNTYNWVTASDAQVDFAFHAFTTSTASPSTLVELQASTDGGATWTTEWSWQISVNGTMPAAIGDDFVPATVDLSAYVGNTVDLRFLGTDGVGFDDIAFDEIMVTACIPCSDPPPPVITSCPSVTNPISADPGVCGAFVDIPDLLFTDGCPDVVVTNDITGTSDADGFYEVGTTIITWTVTDVDNNSVDLPNDG